MRTKPPNHQTTKPVNRASACGKIILSGEYAVVFGKPGIAVPSKERMTVTFEGIGNWELGIGKPSVTIEWPNTPNPWIDYANKIAVLALKHRNDHLQGILRIESSLPLRKGMGSSTALVIALCRCLLGEDCRDTALKIEDAVNPGHSGLDFAVIWEEKPILFKKGSPPKAINLPTNLLVDSRLIDTGTPNETTPELVAWVRSNYESFPLSAAGTPLPGSVREAIETIGKCTERIIAGESLKTVMRDHHRAQMALGVVTPEARKIIAEIEAKDGAGKVLGAGARTGGGGMILVI